MFISAMFPFLIQNECHPCTPSPKGYKLNVSVDTNLLLSPHMFLSYFYPWPYIPNVQISSSNSDIIFSITVHAFRNLLWIICPLFGQILARASFSPSSYSEKIRWGRGCKILLLNISILRRQLSKPLVNSFHCELLLSYFYRHTCLQTGRNSFCHWSWIEYYIFLQSRFWLTVLFCSL